MGFESAARVFGMPGRAHAAGPGVTPHLRPMPPHGHGPRGHPFLNGHMNARRPPQATPAGIAKTGDVPGMIHQMRNRGPAPPMPSMRRPGIPSPPAKPTSPPPPAPQAKPAAHAPAPTVAPAFGPKFVHNAICDFCERIIIGSRHRCTDCRDFDLCDTCLAHGGKHFNGSHVFMEYLGPLAHGPAPRASPSLRRLLLRSRYCRTSSRQQGQARRAAAAPAQCGPSLHYVRWMQQARAWVSVQVHGVPDFDLCAECNVGDVGVRMPVGRQGQARVCADSQAIACPARGRVSVVGRRQ
ncbi:hypothetical protein BCR44DRAFT_1213810 [Catenaria anguillulae PL171]|uniref:ZZ-type domain-containing protein n=1 Tax=Catenaria anguillulae PL171 TaxID=765915 RepID=A0A1Y2HYK5_9FUNG|nr:hypothetical protein BCR44DRAFT_1213810 [Catenaria anguillulae PL171]